MTATQLVRELGMTPLPVPTRITRTVARAVTALPGRPPALEPVAVAPHPDVLDATRAARAGLAPALHEPRRAARHAVIVRIG